jgi:hypothetical protein
VHTVGPAELCFDLQQPFEDPGVHDFTCDLDLVTRKKLVAAQIHRGHQACHMVDSCVAGAVPEMQQLVTRSLQALRGVQKAIELLGSSLGFARLVDAVDAICMLAAGIASIAAQCASPLTRPHS